ncbi:hypothetical protein AB0M00_31210 [Streptomyces chartreusis]|uniref:hypothetical protein n=1 Tax=Streptomyces chartreusis TaxID=1969 RepID=UPI003417D89E
MTASRLRGRPPKLPNDVELLKREAAGLSHAEIAAEFDVSRQAVTKRFNAMEKYARQEYREVAKLLPWDLTIHPERDAISKDESFMGLRAWVRQRLGYKVSARSELALRVFWAHLDAGEVLELDPAQGVQWVRRDPERDKDLVVRWPNGVDHDERTKLFRFTAAQSEATPE